MPIKTPHPIYDTADYPRDGCAIVVDIGASGYKISVFAPGQGPAVSNQPLEIYGCRSSESMAQIVEFLATGKKVPPGAVNT